MPAGDRTGPRGMGPMTGRRGGVCAGYNAPGYANPVPGHGLGMAWGRGGRGGGRGWRHQYYATGLPGWMRYGPTPAIQAYPQAVAQQQTVADLRDQAEWLKEQLEAIQQQITDIEQEA